MIFLFVDLDNLDIVITPRTCLRLFASCTCQIGASNWNLHNDAKKKGEGLSCMGCVASSYGFR